MPSVVFDLNMLHPPFFEKLFGIILEQLYTYPPPKVNLQCYHVLQLHLGAFVCILPV
jgi:hypothetical protein